MKKLTIIFLIIIAFASNAQFYSEFNIGYAFPVVNEKRTIFSKKDKLSNYKMYNVYNLYDHLNDTTIHSSEEIKFTLKQGILFDMGFGYTFKKKLRFSLNIDYFDNHSFNNFNKNNTYKYNEKHIYVDYTTNLELINTSTIKSLTINPNIAYILNHKKISLEIFLGFNITNIWWFTNDEYNYLNIKATDINKSIIITKYKYKPFQEYNINGGLIFLYSINKYFQILFTSKFYFALNTISLPEKTTRYYYSIESTWGQNEINETEIEFNSSDKIYFYKTIDLSLGIRYTFGKNKNSVQKTE